MTRGRLVIKRQHGCPREIYWSPFFQDWDHRPTAARSRMPASPKRNPGQPA